MINKKTNINYMIFINIIFIFIICSTFVNAQIYLQETFDSEVSDCTILNGFSGGNCYIDSGRLIINNSNVATITSIELDTSIISGSSRPTFTMSWDAEYFLFDSVLTTYFTGAYDSSNAEAISSLFFSSNTSLFLAVTPTNETKTNFLNTERHFDMVYNTTDDRVYWYIDGLYKGNFAPANSNYKDFTKINFRGFNRVYIDNLIIQDGVYINEVLETDSEFTELYKDLVTLNEFDRVINFNINGVSTPVFQDSTDNEYHLKPIISNSQQIQVIEDNINCAVGLCVDTGSAVGKFEFIKSLPYLGHTGFSIYLLAQNDLGATATEPQFKINIQNDNNIIVQDTNFSVATEYIKTVMTDVLSSEYTYYSSSATNTFKTQEFYMIVFDSDTNRLKMYRNNEIISDDLFTNDIKDIGDFFEDYIYFNVDFKFDTFALWKRPLSDYEIQTIYNNGNFLDIMNYIDTVEKRNIPLIFDTELYDYIYFETYDYTDYETLDNTYYSYLGNPEEIYILNDNMVFNTSSLNLPYFKYIIDSDEFGIPTNANLKIYFDLSNESYIPDSLIGKPVVFKFEQNNHLDEVYMSFNIAFDRYNDDTLQGSFYTEDGSFTETYTSQFLNIDEDIIVDVLVDYVTDRYTIKFYSNSNAFLGEFGGITKNFLFQTDDLGNIEFGRIDYNDNITSTEFITVEAIAYNLFSNSVVTGDNSFADDSTETTTEPVTEEEMIFNWDVKESIKNFISSIGFRGETGRLIFVGLFLTMVIIAIAKIKEIDYNTKALIIFILSLLVLISGWKLELITTNIFTFIIFAIGVIGAITLRKIFSGSSE